MLLDLGREELLVRPLGLRDRLLVTREKRCEVRLERGIEVAVEIVDGSVRHLPPPSQWAVAGLRPLSTVARPTPGSRVVGAGSWRKRRARHVVERDPTLARKPALNEIFKSRP